MNTTKILCLILLLAGFQASYAQTDTTAGTRVWNLKQCVEYALNSNLVIERSESAVKTASVDYTQAKWGLVPSLNGTVNYRFAWGRNVDPVTNDYTTEELRFLNPSLDASVTLFNGLRIQNTIKQNSRAYYASEQELEKTRNDVMVNITSLYINVIFNKEQLGNARYQLSSSQTQLDRVKKQVAAGSLAKSEELNLDAQVATNEVAVVQAENALNLSILQLKQALQLPATESLDVEMMEVGVEDLVLDQSRDEVYDVAKQIMPEIKSANLRVESSIYAVKAARGNFFPRLSLYASMGSNYSSVNDARRFVPSGDDPIPAFRRVGFVQATGQEVVTESVEIPGSYVDSWGYGSQLKDNLQRALGFQLTIPLLNNYQARASVQRSIINRDVAEISAKEAENTLRQNVENAYNDAVASSKTYNSSLRQVAAREEAFRMITQRREAGAATAFEYQISENDLFRAKSDLTRAKYEFIFRKKILDFYQGKPLDY